MIQTGANAINGTIKMNIGLVISPIVTEKINRLERIKITLNGSRTTSRNWQLINRIIGRAENFIKRPITPLPNAVHNNHTAKMIPSVNSLPVNNRTSSRNSTIWLIMDEKPMAIKAISR